MAKIYANKIMLGQKELSDVPNNLYNAVVAILVEKGFMEAE